MYTVCFRLRAALRGAACGIALLAMCADAAPAQDKTLHLAVTTDGDGFDPAAAQSTVSGLITSNIFDAPYRFAYLARGFVPVPNTAGGPPQISADGLTWTIAIRPGIFFADDAAFGGKPRELTAADYVYSIKRQADPRLIALGFQQLQGRIAGLDALREAAKQSGRFDYDTPIDGLRALDRYRLQIRLTRPTPNLANLLAVCQTACAVAREVVDKYGERLRDFPVGTGPFRLARWVRGARVELERNPGFREEWYRESADEGDADGEAIARRLRGLKLPMLDRVVLTVQSEAQPRWLSFLQGEIDLLDPVPGDLLHLAVDTDGTLAPHLAARGVQLSRYAGAQIRYTFFNFADPTVGGFAPEQIALRRAIALGYNVDAEIAVLQRGHAVAQHSLVGAAANGFDPAFRSPAAEHNPARARALLDIYGFVDRDGDGYRERPDGSALRLELTSPPDGRTRSFDELWRRSMDAIGVRIEFRKLLFAEMIRVVNAGQAMMSTFGWNGTSGDAGDFIMLLYGPNAGSANDARFALPEYDRLYEQAVAMPHGDERNRLLREIDRLFAVYAPLRLHSTPILTDLAQPWVVGYRWDRGNRWLDLIDIQRPRVP